MKKYKYDFTIEASSEQEAEEKMKAITTLVSKLKPKELCKLAHIIQYDPVKTALAKKYLGV
jgi:hypothetical protein